MKTFNEFLNDILESIDHESDYELNEAVTVSNKRPSTHAEHEYAYHGIIRRTHVERTLGLKRGSISKDSKTYIKHGNVHLKAEPNGDDVLVSVVHKPKFFARDASSHDVERQKIMDALSKKPKPKAKTAATAKPKTTAAPKPKK